MTQIILYIATSQDGFIADKNGGVDWLPQPSAELTHADFGYTDLMNRISTIVMGRHSYEQILGFGDWAWSDKMTYVFTSKPLTTSRPDIAFVNDIFFIKNLDTSKDIWLLGGAELINSFAMENLIDECIITIIPTMLNEGIALKLPYENFILNEAKHCSAGIIQNFYTRKK